MTALWALVVILNKKVLEDVHPVAVNFLVRIVAVVGLVCITVPLTAFHLWSNGFGINAAAAGWIALSAVATWLVAFNAYYYALRGGLIAVVAPISSTDPLWTAVFAWLILGTAFGGLTIGGVAVAMAGVVLISRWMEAGDAAGAGAIAGAAHGDVLPAKVADGGRDDAAATSTWGGTTPAPASDTRLRLITLAVVAAAGWGIGPVLVDLASQAYGKPTATMMIESQALGMILLGALLRVRRTPLTTRRLMGPRRRRAVLLLVAAGALEAVVSVLFYLSIANIGPLLTMLIMATTPVFSIVFGVVLLRERPSPRLSLAAAITVAGVLLATLDGLR